MLPKEILMKILLTVALEGDDAICVLGNVCKIWHDMVYSYHFRRLNRIDWVKSKYMYELG
jgi:hypothetical protein